MDPRRLVAASYRQMLYSIWRACACTQKARRSPWTRNPRVVHAAEHRVALLTYGTAPQCAQRWRPLCPRSRPPNSAVCPALQAWPAPQPSALPHQTHPHKLKLSCIQKPKPATLGIPAPGTAVQCCLFGRKRSGWTWPAPGTPAVQCCLFGRKGWAAHSLAGNSALPCGGSERGGCAQQHRSRSCCRSGWWRGSGCWRSPARPATLGTLLS